MKTRDRVARLLAMLERIAEDGVWFDLLLGELPAEVYDELGGWGERLEPDGDGVYFYSKTIDLAGGTVTVETPYERVAA